jgi:peroxiredoxin
VTAFVYESERYVKEGIQILGVSVEQPEEGRKFLDRVTRDCQEDRPHISLDPYPLRLLSDPKGELIRAAGAGVEGHWSGFIAHPVTFVVDSTGKIRWVYDSESASDRPSPVALAKTAVGIAKEERTEK